MRNLKISLFICVFYELPRVLKYIFYERMKLNLQHKNIYFFDDRICAYIFKIFLYLFAGCICIKKANHFTYKHVCESSFVFAFDVLQLTLRVPLRTYLHKR